jgi:hypothetical protein
MPAEGRNGFDWPQMNANDADRSSRDYPSARGNNKSFWNFMAHGSSSRAMKHLRQFAFICGQLRPFAVVAAFCGHVRFLGPWYAGLETSDPAH